MSHNQLTYVAALLIQGPCLFRPGYSQTWALLDGEHGLCVSK